MRFHSSISPSNRAFAGSNARPQIVARGNPGRQGYGIKMALPTLQPYYLTKRNAAAPENIIVRRRTQQRDFKEAWSRNAQYFNQSDVSATKANEWTSTKAFQER